MPHKCDNLPPAFRAVLEGLLWAQPVEKRWSLKQLDAAFHAIQAQAAGRAAAPPQQLQEQLQALMQDEDKLHAFLQENPQMMSEVMKLVG